MNLLAKYLVMQSTSIGYNLVHTHVLVNWHLCYFVIGRGFLYLMEILALCFAT